MQETFIFDSMLDWGALAWFFLLWWGYSFFSAKMARRRDCLAAQLYKYRLDWIESALRRDNRITEISMLDTIQKMANFLATTSILAIAGLVAALSSAKDVQILLQDHPFIVAPTQEQVEFKLTMLVLIFVFSFFRLTWTMRQHTFLLLLLGAAPQIKVEKLEAHHVQLVQYITKIADRASHEFNDGLRAYYFALAFLSWFVNPLVFMAGTIFVVYVLYRREFRSATLKYLTLTRDAMKKIAAEPHA